MKKIEKKLKCILFNMEKLEDNRGWFAIPFEISGFQKIGFRNVCQLNHSYTEEKGVIRGLNFQEEPYSQAKIIRCIKGSLYSVGVDIDKSSSSFGKWCGFQLKEDDNNVMYIPSKYAHGFITLEDCTELEYLTDEKYSAKHAKSIRYDDANICIDWTCNGKIAINKMILSEKNRLAMNLIDIWF